MRCPYCCYGPPEFCYRWHLENDMKVELSVQELLVCGDALELLRRSAERGMKATRNVKIAEAHREMVQWTSALQAKLVGVAHATSTSEQESKR